MERFLALCAEYNMQAANCTTPANFFHLLRRQLHRPFRKPLVVFTPKSLLRHPRCISAIEDFTKGGFKEVMDDVSVNPKDVSRLVFCSGKIYYELLERQEQEKIKDIAIIRLEQLYPLPLNQIKSLLKKYSSTEEYFWVQEEPENMGAWSYLLRVFKEVKLKLISREESASPATGSHKQHEKEQKAIIEKVFEKVLVNN
jgi:2-oxoglutarate dehydrogenase E1 component